MDLTSEPHFLPSAYFTHLLPRRNRGEGSWERAQVECSGKLKTNTLKVGKDLNRCFTRRDLQVTNKHGKRITS